MNKGLKERFLALVSDEKTDTMERNRRRIKYRKLIRIKNRIHLSWLNLCDYLFMKFIGWRFKKTDTIEISEKDIKYGKLIRIKNRIYLSWLNLYNYLFKSKKINIMDENTMGLHLMLGNATQIINHLKSKGVKTKKEAISEMSSAARSNALMGVGLGTNSGFVNSDYTAKKVIEAFED